MKALREICQKYSKWKPIEDYILRIEGYPTNGPMISDNCKCIIESVCHTILDDMKIQKKDQKSKLHELVKQTVEKLGCINKVPGLISAFTNTAQRIAEFRNEYTETGHGQSVYRVDENRKKVSTATISFLIAIIEQTALYLITVYQDEYPKHIQTTLRYEDNNDFNAKFDEQNESIEIGQYGPYRSSEVLFYIDNIAYKTELSNFKQDDYEQNI